MRVFGTGENLGAAQCALRLVYQVQDKVNILKDNKNFPLIKKLRLRHPFILQIVLQIYSKVSQYWMFYTRQIWDEEICRLLQIPRGLRAGGGGAVHLLRGRH